MLEPSLSSAPYPGLRPFLAGESDIFFGREEQVDKLLEKLRAHHFVAVVGPSGCGKSSLVRAGMISALEAGFMQGAGHRWRVADMRPGSNPLLRLADALAAPAGLGQELGPADSALPAVLAQLRRGPLGLVELLQHVGLPERTNLLVLVDQFEEIFRYRRLGDANAADAFVALLLATAQRRELPVYVAITMRSDFLGDCAVFRGLPEAIDDSQFLTPRLTREQMAAAIAGPARVFGGDVDPALVNRLINDVGPDPDQLPVLQHALMRMWDLATRGRRASGPAQGEREVCLTLADYTSIGGLSEALSRHADEVFNALAPTQRRLAEELFKCLTERSEGRRDTRRPATVRELADVTGCATTQIRSVAEAFRAPGVCFITPSSERKLQDDSVLDISHESLIRLWKRMGRWVEDESRKAETYKALKQTALQSQCGTGFVMTRRAVAQMQRWKADARPTAGWAARYGSRDEFEIAMGYLAAAQRRSLYRIAGWVALGGVVATLLGATAVQRYQHLANEANAGTAFQQALDSVAKVGVAGDTALIAAAEAACVRPDLVDAAVRIVVARQMADRSEIARVRAEGDLLALAYTRLGAVAVTQKDAGAEPTVSVLGDPAAQFQLAQVSAARGMTAMNGALSARSDRFALLAGTPVEIRRGPSRAVSMRDDGTLVQIWDLGHPSVARELQLSRPMARVALDPSGQLLAAVEHDGTAWLYDLSRAGTLGASVRRTAEKLTAVSHVQFSANGASLLIVGSARISDAPVGLKVRRNADFAWVLDLTSGEGVRTIRASSVDPWFAWQGALSADGSTVATLSSKGLLEIWDVASERRTAWGQFNFLFPKEVGFFPDGEHVALTSHTGRASIVRWASMAEVPLSDHTDLLLRVVPGLDPQSRQILVQHPDATYRLLALVDLPIQVDSSTVTAAAVSPNGSHTLLGDSQGRLRVQSVTGDSAQNDAVEAVDTTSAAAGMGITTIALSPDGATAVSGHERGQLRFWRVPSSALEAEGSFLDQHEPVSCLAFDHTGMRVVSTAAGGTVAVWDARTGRPLARLDSTPSAGTRPTSGRVEDATRVARPLCAAFEGDGRSIVFLRSDGALWRWDPESAKPALAAAQLPISQAVALTTAKFSQDGAVVAATNEPSPNTPPVVLIWKHASSRSVDSLLGQRNIAGLGRSPGRPGGPPERLHLATGDDEGRYTIWDVSGHTPLAVGARSVEKSAALSADGANLLVVGNRSAYVYRCLACRSDIAGLATEHALRTISNAPDALGLFQDHPCLAKKRPELVSRLSARLASAAN